MRGFYLAVTVPKSCNRTRLADQVPIFGVGDQTGRGERLEGGNHLHRGSALLGLDAAARPGPELLALLRRCQRLGLSMRAQEEGLRGLECYQRPPQPVRDSSFILQGCHVATSCCGRINGMPKVVGTSTKRAR
jgi:hypothetical protein